MKSHIVSISCDWFQVSCLSSWGVEKHESADTDGKPLGVVDARPLFSPVGVVFEADGLSFRCSRSEEVNPAYHEAVLLSLVGGGAVCHLFFRTRNPHVDARSCQAKVANSLLYSVGWKELFYSALRAVQWSVVRLSRVDVAADFQYFVNGRLPLKFVQDYMAKPTASRPSFLRKASNKFRAFGSKAGGRLLFETLSFGTRDSAVQTNLYNKTLELRQKDKPWIRQRWAAAGLPSEWDGKSFVWRLEFSINPSAKYIVDNFGGCVRELRSSDVATSGALTRLFCALVPQFFQFYVLTSDDVRKHRKTKDLQPLELFDLPVLLSAKTPRSESGTSGLTLCGYRPNLLGHYSSRIERQILRYIDGVLDNGALSPAEVEHLHWVRDRILTGVSEHDERVCKRILGDDVLAACFRALDKDKPREGMSPARARREAERIAKVLVGSEEGARFSSGWAEVDALLDSLRDSLSVAACDRSEETDF
jgi:hypothetical protein